MIAATSLRRKISNKVLYLRDLTQHIDALLANGFDQELIDTYLSHVGSKYPKPTSKEKMAKDVDLMFRLGGVISGGAVLSLIHNRPIKDVDFYFNDDLSFIKAYLLTFHNPYIDICWYFDKPHELHDMAVVMCNIYPDNRIEITPQAQKALDTGVSDLYIENFIWPERSAERMLKYNKKYGTKFQKHQVLAMVGLYDLGVEWADRLLSLA